MKTKNKRTDLLFQLGPDEILHWSGRPMQGVMFRPTDLLMVPFSLLWGGFACFWTFAATATGGCFGLFGIPFVLVGLYMVFGRFWADAKERANTFYAVTSERVIINSGLFTQKRRSLPLQTLADFTLEAVDAQGRGTIMFGESSPLAAWYRGMPWWMGTARHVSPAFERIDNAQAVYETILLAQRRLWNLKRGA